jgi:hypothetical protein
MPTSNDVVTSDLQPPRMLWSNALLADLRAYWPLWLIVAAAIFTRLYEFGRIPGMHGDEGWYGVQILNLIDGRAGELRTPTGNVPGLIHGGSLALLHSMFSPSLWLLRVPALISSLGAMAAAYVVGRRFFGPAAGMTALVLMACLPINNAYARIGWDPSHGPMLVLIATYCALAGRRLLSALVFAFALSNHPSAVFVAPFLVLGYLGIQRTRLPWRSASLQTMPLVLALILAIALALLLSAGVSHYLGASKSMTRLFDPRLWADFGVMYGRLLSGDTIYHYIVGRGFVETRPWVDVVTLILLLAVMLAGLWTVLRRPEWSVVGLIAGWLASLAGLYVVAGLWTLQPGLERFGFPMVPVTALAVAAASSRLFQADSSRPLFQTLLSAVALPLLAGFWLCFLIPLDSGEARPNPGSWTGPVEPNQLAVDLIAGATAPDSYARVVAEDWWSYWPIAYYAAATPLVIENADGKIPSPDDVRYPVSTYWIAYGGGELDRALARRGDVKRRWSVATSNPHNVLQIWWSPPPSPGAPGRD